MTPARRALASILLAVWAAGCVQTRFTRTTGLVVPARSPGCYLDVVFEGPPPYPYVVLGQITTDSTAPLLFAIGESSLTAMQRMMERACAVGAHGLMYVVANSELVPVGKGYWKSTTGGGVAFVSVDPSGRPLPAPNDPRGVISPAAYPSPLAPQ
ncbi:MAG TPA: hypothetical protein VGP64_01325 [Polyangia bacterium]|jgi:hypothetical protein